MKIALLSYWFLPHLGGQQIIADLLATEFAERGHAVRVLTGIPGDIGPRPYAITRSNSLAALLGHARWADACLVMGPSVRQVVIPVLAGTRVLITHCAPFRSHAPIAMLQRCATGLASLRVPTHAPSASIASKLPGRHVVFPYPYDQRVFRQTGDERTGHLLYVGRLSSEKGVDTLLHAVGLLREQGCEMPLDVIGDGSHKPELLGLAQRLGIAHLITWHGALYGESVARQMNRHRVLVVPSRWEEPFGIVALEGLACGCRTVVARRGGLTEAAGRWGYYFENGDPRDLARAIREACRPARPPDADRALQDHLAAHAAPTIASRFLEMLQ